MADNSFKVNKSINLNPQASLPANPVDGDFYYDSTVGSYVFYHLGFWESTDAIGIIPSATNLTSAQFTPAVVQNSAIRITGSTISSLYGMAASFSARRITIYNDSSALLIIKDNNTFEPVAINRIITPTGGDMNVPPGEIVVFLYDIVPNRWALVSIGSGAGAQIVATTTNNGVVTLHQASGTPLTPIVLTDGDLNTANGVVGLDANKAATISPTTGNTTALTATGFGTGSGVSGTGGTNNGTGVIGSGTGTGIGVSGVGGSSGASGVFGQGTGTSTGVTGDGGSTNGSGVAGFGGGTTGIGILGQGAGTPSGIPGAAASAGGAFFGNATGANGVYAHGHTTGAGITTIGGTSSGDGIDATSGGGNGNGVNGTGSGIGTGVIGTGGNGGSGGSGVIGQGGFPSGIGVSGTGGDTGVGVSGTGGVSGGDGVTGQGTVNGRGVVGVGAGSGVGGQFTGGGAGGIGSVSVGVGNFAGVVAVGAGSSTAGDLSGTNGVIGLVARGSPTGTGGDAIVAIAQGTSQRTGVNGTGSTATSGNNAGGKGVIGTGGNGFGTSQPGGTGVAGIGGFPTGSALAGNGGDFQAGGSFPGSNGDTWNTGVTGTGNGTGHGVGGFGGGNGGTGVFGEGGSSNGKGVHGLGSGTGVGGYFENGTTASGSARTNAVLLENGDLNLVNVSNVNPNVAVNKTVTPSNITKVWALIRAVNNTATVVDGFNISSVAGGSNQVQITFAQAFATANYAITMNCNSLDSTSFYGAYTPITPIEEMTGSGASRIPTRTASQININFTLDSGALAAQNANNVFYLHIICEGNQ